MESVIPNEGHNSPQAMALSVAKRYNQFKVALPQADNDELFQLILDNRYKLLGNLVSVAGRAEIISKATSSLTLLTFFIMLTENAEIKVYLNSNETELGKIIITIFEIVNSESSVITEPPVEELLILARNHLS